MKIINLTHKFFMSQFGYLRNTSTIVIVYLSTLYGFLIYLDIFGLINFFDSLDNFLDPFGKFGTILFFATMPFGVGGCLFVFGLIFSFLKALGAVGK